MKRGLLDTERERDLPACCCSFVDIMMMMMMMSLSLHISRLSHTHLYVRLTHSMKEVEKSSPATPTRPTRRKTIFVVVLRTIVKFIRTYLNYWFRLTYVQIASTFKCVAFSIRNLLLTRKNLNIPKLPDRVVVVPGLASETDFLSPYGSSHDRACELFYYLKGGVVDYGVYHSEKYKHSRFGTRFEKGYVPEWDEMHPIILVAHSHGGNTARMLQHLLHHQHFESHVTSATWIRAIICVASPLRGCSLMYRLGMPRRSELNGAQQSTGPWYSLVRIGQTLGYTLHLLTGSKMHRWGLEKWDMKLCWYVFFFISFFFLS